MYTYNKKHIDMTDDIVTLCGIDFFEDHACYSTICETLTGNGHTYVSDSKLTLFDAEQIVEVSTNGVIYYLFDVSNAHRLDVPDEQRLLGVEDVNIAAICRHVHPDEPVIETIGQTVLQPQRGVLESTLDTINYGQTTIYKR